MTNRSLAQDLNRFESALQQCLAAYQSPASKINQAMDYALFPGGKRLRPSLVYLSGALLEVDPCCLDSIAIAVELVHAYSLIHDDLPAMDNDDFRRGKASCHRAFDEATAILVGDGLQALAIEILIDQLSQQLPAAKLLQIVLSLSKASGINGMIAGQSLDLSELSHRQVTEAALKKIHRLKTGALIKACIDMVNLASQAPEQETTALGTFAEGFGLLFQMQDDYLDRYASASLGKGRQSDLENEKFTFAALYPQAVLLEKMLGLYQQAQELLLPFGKRAAALSSFLIEFRSKLSPALDIS